MLAAREHACGRATQPEARRRTPCLEEVVKARLHSSRWPAAHAVVAPPHPVLFALSGTSIHSISGALTQRTHLELPTHADDIATAVQQAGTPSHRGPIAPLCTLLLQGSRLVDESAPWQLHLARCLASAPVFQPGNVQPCACLVCNHRLFLFLLSSCFQ